MMAQADTDRNLLFGLLALQNALIDQDQLVGTFRVWSRDPSRGLADRLVNRGDLDDEQRPSSRAWSPIISRSTAARPSGASPPSRSTGFATTWPASTSL